MKKTNKSLIHFFVSGIYEVFLHDPLKSKFIFDMTFRLIVNKISAFSSVKKVYIYNQNFITFTLQVPLNLLSRLLENKYGNYVH